MLLAALAMATAAMTAASAAKTATRALRCALRAAAFARIVMGFALAHILSGLLRHLSFRHRLDGLVVLRVEAECHFHLNPCLKASVKGEVIFAIAYGSVYLRMQSSLEEHVLVVTCDVNTLAGRDNIGAERCNDLIGALLC